MSHAAQFCWACVLAVAVSPVAVQAQPILIDDAGFERTPLSPCAFTSGFVASGWQVEIAGSGAGAWRPDICWDIAAIEGVQVAYSNGSAVRQTLAVNATPGQEYTLSWSLGRRTNPCCPWQTATIELLADSTPIGTAVIPLGLAPPAGSWAQYSLTARVPSNLPVGLPLVIRFRADGPQVDFDAFRLTAGRGCAADFNGDGFLDFFDFDDFVSCFEGLGCPPGKDADFNGDGFADFFDYDDFVAAFEAGC